jgi:hypothetical protein
MTAKKKPRTGGTGLPRIPCMVMMEVGGTCHHHTIYDRAVNLERQPAPYHYPLGNCATSTRAFETLHAVPVNA